MPLPSAPLGVVHGYGLSGSGSNLWTRAVLRALARLGHTVHAVCQERAPERYDFVAEAVRYAAPAAGARIGAAETLFSRETPYPGRVVVHRPDLDVLPIYVQPSRPSDYVVYTPELSDDAIEGYLARNAALLEHVAREHGVVGFVVNHTVLMAPAAARARARGGAPFAVLPHGSAIEYVVKKDDRVRRLAEDALGAAARVFALNGEMEGRITDVFGEALPGIAAAMGRMPVGTDTSVFELVSREDRPAAAARIAGVIEGAEPGRSAADRRALAGAVQALPVRDAGDAQGDAELLDAVGGADYTRSAPDADLAERLAAVDTDAPSAVFVGRLIAAKGAPALVAAWPLVVQAHPDAVLYIAGEGALREGLEAFVAALRAGRADLVRRIARLGGGLEGAGGLDADPFFAVHPFVESLGDDEMRAYLDAAQAIGEHQVVFTGFLDHDALGPLYGLADAGAFPSVVREASPLVVPESAAAGVLPIGPDVGGMGDSLRTLGDGLPNAARPLLLVRPDAEHRVRDLADNLVTALSEPRRWAAELRREAEARFDWTAIAEGLAAELASLDADTAA